jgi:HTH-type transcriptional regulator/antitoxin HigA
MSATLTRPTSKGTYSISPKYLRLLRRYPLLPIKSEQDYDRADSVLADLFGREDLDRDESRYLDSLLILISAYEDKHWDFDKLAEAIPPLQALKSIMSTSGTTQSDLAVVLGSEAAASMLLSGKRQVSKSQAKALARHFKVDAGLFI